MFRKTKDYTIDILLNEYRWLGILRERAIKSIESSAIAYTTFLGLIGNAISIFLKGENSPNWHDWLIVVLIGLGTYFFGWKIHHLLIVSHNNMIRYTRYINRTRNKLTDLVKINYIEYYIPLERCDEKPPFDNLGFSNIKSTKKSRKFSKQGILGIVKWMNSILLGMVLCIFFSQTIPTFFNFRYSATCFSIFGHIAGVCAVITSVCFHGIHHRNLTDEETRDYDRKKDLHLHKSTQKLI